MSSSIRKRLMFIFKELSNSTIYEKETTKTKASDVKIFTLDCFLQTNA